MMLTESTRSSLDAQLAAKQYDKVASILERALKASPKETSASMRTAFWDAVSRKEVGGSDNERYRDWERHEIHKRS